MTISRQNSVKSELTNPLPHTTNEFLSISPESTFLHTLFRDLCSAQIPYAVMRNHEPLPHSSGGSDLDILINPADETETKRIIYGAIKKADGGPIGCATTIGFFKVYALGHNGNHPDKWWGQRIDVNVGLVYNGVPLLDDTGWQLFIIKHNSINVLSDDLAGVLGVLKEVLNNSERPQRYMASAQGAVDNNWHQIKKALQPMGEPSLTLLRKLIQRDKGAGDIPQLCNQLRTTLTKHALRKHPFATIQQRFGTEWSKVKRVCFPSGVVIAILGVDGAGKSTVINAIKPPLDMATHNATFVQHLRPGLLPPLARIKGKDNMPPGVVTNPHGSNPSGFFGSLFRLLYLITDYIFGYWLKIRPKIGKQPTVIIFDRYAYDMLLDPKRFRIKLPGYIIKLFIYFIPKPHLTFCLYGNAEIIAARKQELSVTETKKQISALKALAHKQKHSILISTENNIVKTRDEVLNKLLNFLSIRAND